MASKSTDDEDRSGSPHSALSLDVLAQVASDRLQTDNAKCKTKDKSIQKKRKQKGSVTKRNLQSMDQLDLTLIPTLSDKLLLNLFTEMSSDEIRKQYTLTCYLEPGECTHQVTVYGNEMKAKIEMKQHLHHHLQRLKEAYRDDPEAFSAETAVGRKKRIQYEHNKQIRMKKKLKKEPVQTNTINGIKRRGRPPNFPQTLHDYAGLGVAIDKGLLEKDAQQKHKIEEAAKARFDLLEKCFPPDENDEDNSEQDVNQNHAIDEMEISDNKENSEVPPQNKQTIQNQSHPEAVYEEASPSAESQKNTEQSSSDLDKEQLIIDLMSKSQPYQDHNYTSIFGKRRGIETMQHDYDSEEELEEEFAMISSRTIGKRFGRPIKTILSAVRPNVVFSVTSTGINVGSSLTYPVVKMPPFPIKEIDSTPEDSTDKKCTVLSQEIVAWEELKRLASKMTQKRSAYPPMPMANLDKQGRIPEENLMGYTNSDDDKETPKEINRNVNPYKRGRRTYDTMGGEWERKTALKCIRELRTASKKKEEMSLVCRICKNRTFTATATLMYHYRSHAGIKPFVCLICNTTFTRQHSLNYHMLIHNNQSRFTCRECGRKFRHPSHFKEHMRRHTGETPYHCTDCPLRFKTRNTYKRHLRTRHDKMLTAVGIKNMSAEEVERYKTMCKIAMRGIETDSGDTTEGDDSLKTGKKIKDIIKSGTKAKVYPKIMKTEIGSGFTQTSVQVSVAKTPCGTGLQRVIPIQQQSSGQVNSLQTVSTASPVMTAQGSALQLQIPNQQTLNISGLQLQLPGHHMQVPVMQTQDHTAAKLGAQLQMPLLQASNNSQAGNPQQLQVPVVQAAQTAVQQQIQVPLMQTQAITGTSVTQIQVPVMQAAQSVPGQTTSQIQVPVVQTQQIVGQQGSQIQVPFIHNVGNNFATRLQVPLIQTRAIAGQSRLQVPLLQAQSGNGQSVSQIQMAGNKPITVTQLAQVSPASGAAPTQLIITPTHTTAQAGFVGMPINQTTFQLGNINQVGGAATLQTVQALLPLSTAGTTTVVPSISQATAITPIHIFPAQSSAVTQQQQINTPNTPAANTLLKFCSQVANQN